MACTATVAPIIQAALTVSPRCSASTPRQAAAKAARAHQDSFLSRGMGGARGWGRAVAYAGSGRIGTGRGRCTLGAPTPPESAMSSLLIAVAFFACIFLLGYVSRK